MSILGRMKLTMEFIYEERGGIYEDSIDSIHVEMLMKEASIWSQFMRILMEIYKYSMKSIYEVRVDGYFQILLKFYL